MRRNPTLGDVDEWFRCRRVRREILFEWKGPQIIGDSRTNKSIGESRFMIVLEMKAENGMLQ